MGEHAWNRNSQPIVPPSHATRPPMPMLNENKGKMAEKMEGGERKNEHVWAIGMVAGVLPLPVITSPMSSAGTSPKFQSMPANSLQQETGQTRRSHQPLINKSHCHNVWATPAPVQRGRGREGRR